MTSQKMKSSTLSLLNLLMLIVQRQEYMNKLYKFRCGWCNDEARCEELMDKALATISLDLDGDGVVDSGEEVLPRKGGSASDFRASWRTYSKSANDSFFTPKRGMRH